MGDGSPVPGEATVLSAYDNPVGHLSVGNIGNNDVHAGYSLHAEPQAPGQCGIQFGHYFLLPL